ncbi:MAG: alpha-L-glutamate ligase [Proteobacteria bacterium]|nr:alpha-L-glutamate ligase [Pseudomonadota bacterium]
MNTTVHVLYENPDWNPPLVAGLEAQGFNVELHFLDGGLIDPSTEPAEGLWLNRVSPSSHTRDHSSTVPLAREVLFWLEHHGRRVINGSHAFELEMSKLRQDLLLRRHGLNTPKTVLAVGTANLVAAARTFDGPFITKHNQGGKGLGIELFNSADQLETYLNDGAFDPGPDGKIILQQYIQAPEPFITRVEIVGGRFLFAMRSRTDEGFQLCPSDACQVPASNPDVCPADPSSASKFAPSPLTADDPLVQKLVAMCVAEGIEVAGIEFIVDAEGNRYVYDINGTTNYSGVLAEQTGVHGMHELAKYLRTTVVPKLAVA